jgi:phosphoribosylanthranilate isomerase
VIVKICGITRPQDAERAVALGATAIGFMFWPSSPRRVGVDAARSIGRLVPASVMKVGVFVDATAEELARAVAEVGLDAVQLHGSEAPDVVRDLGARVIKAVALGSPDTDAQVAQWTGTTLLLDAHDPVRRGGTGRVIDWDRAAWLARRHEVILAGGLNPENVAEAVRRVRPAGIDVSSGVEQTPGVKDLVKLAAFFDALAGVGCEP